jgi:hypothetical protein
VKRKGTMDSIIEEPPPKKAKRDRLEELYHQDVKEFFQGGGFNPCFFLAEKAFPVNNVSTLETENLVGDYYDLVFTTGCAES